MKLSRQTTLEKSHSNINCSPGSGAFMEGKESMKNNMVSGLLTVVSALAIVGGVAWGIWALAHFSWKTGEDIVSGIIYNAQFNDWPAENTTFQVRAAAEMAVTEETSPTYCLPKGSPYESIVREAAEDKSIKVIVKVKPMPPHFKEGVFKCEDNIEVVKKDEGQ